MTDSMVFGEPLDREVEALLGRFAQARLTPDPDAMARVRRAVMAKASAAATTAAGVASAAASPAAVPTLPSSRVPSATSRRERLRELALAAGVLGRDGSVDRTRRLPPSVGAPRRVAERQHRPFGSWAPRRLGLAMGIAVLAGGALGGTAFAGSQAGGPLYAARLWIETMTLPADAEARLHAEIARAQTRLAEVAAALARGDAPAAEAALTAYARIVDETLAGIDDATGRQQALLAFQQHVEVLTALADDVPAAARDAIADALARSSAAIDRLKGEPGDRGGGSGGGNGAPAGNNGNGQGAPGGPSADPGATSDPEPTRTPKPTKPPKSPAPDATHPVATPEPPSPPEDPGRPDDPDGGNAPEDPGPPADPGAPGGDGGGQGGGRRGTGGGG